MADRSLENTPTWAITGVCFVLIAIALGAEYGLHLLASLFTKKKTKPLDQALERIKADEKMEVLGGGDTITGVSVMQWSAHTGNSSIRFLKQIILFFGKDSLRIWNWVFAILSILFNAHIFYSYFWQPFIPLVVLVVVGAKMESIITTMGVESQSRNIIVNGSIVVKPNDDLFWFRRPHLLLHLIHFILFQNSFQLAFITWTWYKFGIQSCYYKEPKETIICTLLGVLVQFLCGYVTLPLYALVSQMGSTMKETVFTESISKALKNWHSIAKENIENKRNPELGSPLSLTSSPSITYDRDEELDEITELKQSCQKTSDVGATETEASQSNGVDASAFDGEASFGVYVGEEPSFRQEINR
ncbi:MLO-like protein 6 [Acorus gramineus]|uniref:MLO-like protein 6 n=1 Tax=Acorus gramineus TaxID=55184 RepID=A0AAV9BJY5_ACOGR|nr:MLO-like protein 6 [Acorus gramineus]